MIIVSYEAGESADIQILRCSVEQPVTYIILVIATTSNAIPLKLVLLPSLCGRERNSLHRIFSVEEKEIPCIGYSLSKKSNDTFRNLSDASVLADA